MIAPARRILRAMPDYVPPQEVLANYADLLVKFALNDCRGIKPGDVVQLTVPDCAKPLLPELMRAVYQSGGHVKQQYIPDGLSKIFFTYASDEQLTFFPEAFKKAETELVDHNVSIISDGDPHELKDIDPKRLFMASDSRKKVREWYDEKERQGKFSWTLAMYPTAAMAAEAGMSLQEYWQQVIEGCYLDKPDPVAEWKRIQAELDRLKGALNALKIERVHVEAEGIDLWVKLGANRQWLGGSGRNIPSYELFISPDWRGTEGVVRFNQPLYRFGNLVKDVALEFKDGRVVKASASQGEDFLKAMIARENADKIGEFSLTDRRISRITRFMADTLFDENMGGPFGNTHLAVGKAYKDSFDGDQSKPSKEEWEAMGFNESPEHTDIVSTTDRTVTAELPGGGTTVIFKDGQFTL